MSKGMSEFTNSTGSAESGPADRSRFLSEADCKDLLARLVRVADGGGHTTVTIASTWTGNVRWARNQVSTSGEVQTNVIKVTRNLNGARSADVYINETSDVALVAAARRAERLARLTPERPQSELAARYQPEPFEPHLPQLFSEATYQLGASQRAEVARRLAQSAEAAGMLSAGYIEVSAHGTALLDTFGRVWYYPYTAAQYSVTVRDPKGTGSGWAGVDNYDWAKIEGEKLSQLALEKCLQSRNPVAVEPGRYTTILEPQAVCDFVGPLVFLGALDREWAEFLKHGPPSPFLKSPPNQAKRLPGFSRLGEQVIDPRLSIGADPGDPDLGFPPFDVGMNTYWGDIEFDRPVYHPVTWIDHGILTHLAYDRHYGLSSLGLGTGLPNSGAVRMDVSGPTHTVDEMIASTKRGLLVTRFDEIMVLSQSAQLYRGHTRDGLWLIENGKISKPVKNLIFTESILFALNNVEQLGVPQRVFNPSVATLFSAGPHPVIVPALKIKDFSFTALDDAV